MFASALAIIWYCADAEAAVDGMAWLDMLCGISSQTEIVDVSNAVEMECRQTEKGLERMEKLRADVFCRGRKAEYQTTETEKSCVPYEEQACFAGFCDMVYDCV